MSKQDGGKLIGQGSFGCAYRPALPCKGSKVRPPNKISKLMFRSEALKELAENKTIDKIDPKGIFHFTAPAMCDYDMKTMDPNVDGVRNDCNAIYSLYPGSRRHSILNYTDGGQSVSDYLREYLREAFHLNYSLQDREEDFLEFFFAMENVMFGLTEMAKHSYCHFDIKGDNMVIEPTKMDIKFIDYGISMPFNKVYRFEDLNRCYFVWPYDVALLNKEYLPLIEMMAMESKRKHPNIILMTDFYDRIQKKMSAQYRKSYSITFANEFIQGENPYTSILDYNYSHRFNPIMNIVSDFSIAKNGDYLKKFGFIEKLDVFSVGLILAQSWTSMMGIKFINDSSRDFLPPHKINNVKNPEVLNNIRSLIISMIQGYYKERESSMGAYNRFLEIKKQMFEKPKAVSPVVKPASIESALSKQPSLNPESQSIVTSGSSKSSSHHSYPIARSATKPPPKPPKSKTKKRKATPPVKVCPPGKILNPKTNRCINDPALKPTKAPKKPAAKKNVTEKVCPPGKILNPKTNRCINDPALKPAKAPKKTAKKK